MIRSEQEKDIYKVITEGPMEKLQYPLKEWTTDLYGTEYFYEIPKDKKFEEIKKLWPFADEIAIGMKFTDIHSGWTFKIEDAIIIRFDEYNMLVSPKYFMDNGDGGGTCLDFVRPEEYQGNGKAIVKTYVKRMK